MGNKWLEQKTTENIAGNNNHKLHIQILFVPETYNFHSNKESRNFWATLYKTDVLYLREK